MRDQPRQLVSPIPHPGSRRVLRTAWSGAMAAVTAGGLLFTALANAPAPLVAGPGPESPAPVHRLTAAATVPAAAFADVRLNQVEAVLGRVEQEMRKHGPDLSRPAARAAAELGMLYTTYRWQQLTPGRTNGTGRTQDPPVTRKTEPDGGASEHIEQAARPVDVPSAVQVSAVYTPAAAPDGQAAQARYVTYDQVVTAAVRLMNLLDSTPEAPARVQVRAQTEAEVPPAERRDGPSRRERLSRAVTSFGDSTLGYANGRIPAVVLCPLRFAPGHLLRCDAAGRLTALSSAFEREFGSPIPITDSYRSYEQQVAVAGAKPHLAAVPGTSNHGWGLAVDLSSPISGGASEEYVWLRVHGPEFGWDNPPWARPGGTKPEPWHFEFFAAGPVPDRATAPSDVGTRDTAEAAGRVEAASPQRPALDPGRKDGSSDHGTRQRPAQATDEPSSRPPAQRPDKATPKPKPKPAASTPTPRPTPPKASPAPSPTPTPTPTPPASPPPPSPSPIPTPPEPTTSPAPSPAPPEPSQEPSASPTPSQAPPEPPPSPAPATSLDPDAERVYSPSTSPSAGTPG